MKKFMFVSCSFLCVYDIRCYITQLSFNRTSETYIHRTPASSCNSPASYVSYLREVYKMKKSFWLISYLLSNI